MSTRRGVAMLRALGTPAATALANRIVGRPHRVTRAPMRLQHLIRNGLAAARIRAGNRRLIRSSIGGSVSRAASMMRRGFMGALARARARIAARRTMDPRAPIRARPDPSRLGLARAVARRYRALFG